MECRLSYKKQFRTRLGLNPVIIGMFGYWNIDVKGQMLLHLGIWYVFFLLANINRIGEPRRQTIIIGSHTSRWWYPHRFDGKSDQ